MRYSLLFATLVASCTALTVGRLEAEDKLYTIELAPGETKIVSETEKWALKAEGKHFFDITENGDFSGLPIERRAAVTYPKSMGQTSAVKTLLPMLSKTTMQGNLATFSAFYNRYYKSTYGKQSSEWLLSQVQDVIKSSGAKNVTVAPFQHSWGQSSVIATIPGKSAKTIVIGAHQDSINLSNPSGGKAPGADDDGSGTVTILEAFRVLLMDSTVVSNQAPNTIEFHWYSAEEGGLLGSQAIFQQYAKQGRDVKAMLQQDMTGYVQGTIDHGNKISVGVITDFVDTGLTSFIKLIINAYCSIPYVETKCGYACSDHASATKAGYPSAFVIEAAFDDTSDYIHSTQDTMSTVDFDHVLEHAKMTTGFSYELAFASL